MSRRFNYPCLIGVSSVAVIVLFVIGIAWKHWTKPNSQPISESSFAFTPLSESPFLNTKSEAHYVGSAQCASCHPGAHASHRRTGMGRSMAVVDIRREPPDAAYDHPLSGRRYQVYRRDGQMFHRELLLDKSEEIVLADFPVKYVCGSGRHSLTYVVEVDGFLVESPITWYTARKSWGMSPGYDKPDNPGFQRAIDEGCLICHAGQSHAVDGSLHRMKISELAIGCERCHGPGSLHVANWQGRARQAKTLGEIDYTIVNPSHLSRELAEAVCQQCHLRSSATVVSRGRRPSDYRPGLPLQDFRQDYRFKTNQAMKVTGHVEQMHQSRCYQGTETLSCLTCHNPHAEPRAREVGDYYNSICQSCHQPQDCNVSVDRRHKESPDNNCVHCHMPRSPTEIPHLAFTHHRIGVHDGSKSATDKSETEVASLEPFLDFSRLSELDVKRSLGLGYLEAANREHEPARVLSYSRRAIDLLEEVRRVGLPDASVDVALARLRFDMQLGDYLPYAASALTRTDLVGIDRCTALFLLADAEAGRSQHAAAAAALRQLVRLRRHAVDWLLLADCERDLGNDQAFLEALHNAVGINPGLSKVHRYLAEHYRKAGSRERESWHEVRGRSPFKK